MKIEKLFFNLSKHKDLIFYLFEHRDKVVYYEEIEKIIHSDNTQLLKPLQLEKNMSSQDFRE